MTTRNVSQAKAELSSLLALVEQGEEVVIARAGKPVAKLVQLESVPPQRVRLGMFPGSIVISDNFDDPDPEFEALFYEGPIEPAT